jgi:hypothetical protein
MGSERDGGRFRIEREVPSGFGNDGRQVSFPLHLLSESTCFLTGRASATGSGRERRETAAAACLSGLLARIPSDPDRTARVAAMGPIARRLERDDFAGGGAAQRRRDLVRDAVGRRAQRVVGEVGVALRRARLGVPENPADHRQAEAGGGTDRRVRVTIMPSSA